MKNKKLNKKSKIHGTIWLEGHIGPSSDLPYVRLALIADPKKWTISLSCGKRTMWWTCQFRQFRVEHMTHVIWLFNFVSWTGWLLFTCLGIHKLSHKAFSNFGEISIEVWHHNAMQDTKYVKYRFNLVSECHIRNQIDWCTKSLWEVLPPRDFDFGTPIPIVGRGGPFNVLCMLGSIIYKGVITSWSLDFYDF